MKKLFAIAGFILFAVIVHSQNFLYNGNGYFENRTPELDAAMAAIPGKVGFGIPGGPISKLVDPYNVPRGWGLDDAYTQSIFSIYPDEDGSSVTKWLQKEDQQPSHSFLDDCISLSAQYPGEFYFVYRFNINQPAADNYAAISYLITGGCEIYGIVAGSEVYSWLDFDTTKYFALAQPTIDLVHGNYPSLKIALCFAPNPERSRDHVPWNNAMVNYRKLHPEINAFDVHLYEGPNMAISQPAPRVITAGVTDTELKNYMLSQHAFINDNTDMSNRISVFKSLAGTAELWCMEGFTNNPSGYFGNTWCGASAQFTYLTENFSQMDITGKQSGGTPDLYGDYSRINNYDPAGPLMRQRTGYLATVLGLECVYGSANKISGDLTEGFYKFNSIDPLNLHINVPAGYAINQIKIRRCTGKEIYSSAGGTQYMAKGTVPTNEISGITEEVITSSNVSIPAYSFGNISVSFYRIPVYGCTDPAALNYNSAANTNDGSCYYFEDCGCKISTATNYDPGAPCENNLICTYPPPPPPEVCYKKRWLFSGCKVDPNCKVDNCKQ